MKKFSLFVISALLGIGVFGADVDLLIWNINLNPNVEDRTGLVENYKFDSIDRFYLKSKSDGFEIDLYEHTYTDLDIATQVSSDYSERIGRAATRGTTSRYVTDWNSLTEAILDHTQGDSVANGEWEFYMQLSNQGNMIAWSEHLYKANPENSTPFYYDTVAPNVVHNPNMMSGTALPAFNFGSNLVPEPTSGLLMMLGAGLLALRRRRRA